MVSDIPTLQQNIRYLNQAAQLVDSLPDAVYRFSDHPIFMSSVGKHLRHILDYYSAFLAGFGRHIDYEARQRDIRTETDRREAAGRISNTIKALIKTVPEASVLNLASGCPATWGSGRERSPLWPRRWVGNWLSWPATRCTISQ